MTVTQQDRIDNLVNVRGQLQIANVVLVRAAVLARAAVFRPCQRAWVPGRGRRQPVCSSCGSRRQRGGPPLLFFRGTGYRCTDCVRDTAGLTSADDRSPVEELISRVAA